MRGKPPVALQLIVQNRVPVKLIDLFIKRPAIAGFNNRNHSASLLNYKSAPPDGCKVTIILRVSILDRPPGYVQKESFTPEYPLRIPDAHGGYCRHGPNTRRFQNGQC